MWWLLAALLLEPGQAPDFTKQIRPILERHCVRCHGAREARSDLRLDLPSTIRRGGIRGPALVAGQPEKSLLFIAVTEGIDGTRMPAEGRPLAREEIDLIRRWIAAGAPMPKAEGVVRSRVSHWAFQPVQAVPVPTFRGRWPRNPIDAFVLRRLHAAGLEPSPPAEPTTLLRRVYLDLIGLLPDPEIVDHYLANPRPDRYERLVDRLLASPHYGERWARHWLDLARYADSHGYTIDGPRSIWPYRDWVIRALNRNVPFDRFVIEQIAGDLLPDATREQLVATGFHRNTLLNQEGGTDPEEFRVKAVVDRVNTTGAVFLGLTIGCAQCHEHKYDPISQREYYELFAFFNSDDEPTLSLPTPEQERQLATIQRQLEEAYRRVQSGVLWTAASAIGSVAGSVGWVQAVAFATELRSMEDGLETIRRLVNERKKLLRRIPTTLVLRKRARPRPTHVMIRGDFLRRGARVEPNVPRVLPPLKPRGSTPDRLDLARWLVSAENPLTPRVTVNRIWQRYFGLGLVATENDFGTRGERPTHPALLDWLAARFVAGGWNLKRLHRLLVTSATYRQSSAWRHDLAAKDPRNRLLGRQNRLRVEAEIVRDLALCAAGLLSYRIGGPGVYPPQPSGIYRFTQVKKPWPESRGEARYRRGLYIYFWRSSPYPFLITFDAPRATTTCTRRVRSNTPLQALMLANDRVFLEAARSLGRRLQEHASGRVDQGIEQGFLICLSRRPDKIEVARLTAFWEAERDAYAGDREAAAALVGEQTGELLERAAWVSLARVLLNLDEFITRE